jgi:hypothetical protein
MAELTNPRWERFAQLCALLNSASEAYRKLCGERASVIRNVDVNSHQLMSKPGVRERIAELRAENDKKAMLSREQMLAWLTRVITTGAGDVIPSDSLCQAHKHTSGNGWDAHEIRLPDKLAAAAQLAKMCDWNAADRVQITGDSLGAYIVALRKKPIGAEVIEGEVRELENGGNSDEAHQEAQDQGMQNQVASE